MISIMFCNASPSWGVYYIENVWQAISYLHASIYARRHHFEDLQNLKNVIRHHWLGGSQDRSLIRMCQCGILDGQSKRHQIILTKKKSRYRHNSPLTAPYLWGFAGTLPLLS